MSTRSQLRFTDGRGTVAQVYRHSDGYPSAVLPTLARLRDTLADAGSGSDAAYTAANFIFLCKLEGMRFYEDDIDDPLDPKTWDVNQPFFFLGYGVENPDDGIHGDEEYLYIVDVSGDWSVKVSGHNDFPRWDELKDLDGDAFDHTDWQDIGPLDELAAEYIE